MTKNERKRIFARTVAGKIAKKIYQEKISLFFDYNKFCENSCEFVFLEVDETDEILAKTDLILLDVIKFSVSNSSKVVDILKKNNNEFYIFIDDEWLNFGCFCLNLKMLKNDVAFENIDDKIMLISTTFDRKFCLDIYDESNKLYVNFEIYGKKSEMREDLQAKKLAWLRENDVGFYEGNLRFRQRYGGKQTYKYSKYVEKIREFIEIEQIFLLDLKSSDDVRLRANSIKNRTKNLINLHCFIEKIKQECNECGEFYIFIDDDWQDCGCLVANAIQIKDVFKFSFIESEIVLVRSDFSQKICLEIYNDDVFVDVGFV